VVALVGSHGAQGLPAQGSARSRPALLHERPSRPFVAVIRADTTVQHGRVIRALDLLKEAGMSRIAFGVTPAAPGGAPAGLPAPAPAPVPASDKQ